MSEFEREEFIGAQRLILGDCLEVMRDMPASSVDSIVTDPPYGLSFMGKAWDKGVPSVEVWTEALRVLKPGGHLLAFAGTRTQHRMAVGIEDVGFEIRDMIAWVYGSGFPKSLDVSKAIDKVRDWSKIERLNEEIKRARISSGLSLKEIGKAMQNATGGQYGAWYHRGGHMFFETGRNLPSRPEWEHLRLVLPIGLEFQDAYDEAEREVVGKHSTDMGGLGGQRLGQAGGDITTPATDAARQWDGWGTALKPALEPITVARKPLTKGNTVAANVLEHGTGGLNVDGCRVAGDMGPDRADGKPRRTDNTKYGKANETINPQSPLGRWPANLIHDGSDEVVRLFPVTTSGSWNGQKPQRKSATDWKENSGLNNPSGLFWQGDSGSAARFFYCAKASKADRGDGNSHATVKPTDLMRYLCRLVTPPGGVVLDPFMGSGSTGRGAVLEGFEFIGIELDPDYFDIACKRVEEATRHPDMFLPQPEAPK